MEEVLPKIRNLYKIKNIILNIFHMASAIILPFLYRSFPITSDVLGQHAGCSFHFLNSYSNARVRFP
jgi:hypothetical protein